MKKVVLLFTGGFESLYNLEVLSKNYKVILFYVFYGQANSVREKEAINYYATLYGAEVKEVECPLFFKAEEENGVLKNGNVPCRNMAFLSLAGNYATSIGADCVCLGVTGDKSWFDGHKGFLDSAQEIFKRSYGIKVLSPSSKVGTVKLSDKLRKIDHNQLTFCPQEYNSSRNCGRCEKCLAVKKILGPFPRFTNFLNSLFDVD